MESNATSSHNVVALKSAKVAKEDAALGTKLFCIGNPSSIDLENINRGKIEFEPSTFHCSKGHLENYLNPTVYAENEKQSGRGRAPTRKEKRMLQEAAQTPFDNPSEGLYLTHTCWTYWGHSGAPLFNAEGFVIGLHCAWDEKSGIRYGQKLQHLKTVINQANQEVNKAAVRRPPQKKRKK